MTKLCSRGKAAAKRKFKVYPSAYANAYASKICAGKIKDPSGVKRKDFRGPKPMKQGDMVNVKKYSGGALSTSAPQDSFSEKDFEILNQRKLSDELGGFMPSRPPGSISPKIRASQDPYQQSVGAGLNLTTKDRTSFDIDVDKRKFTDSDVQEAPTFRASVQKKDKNFSYGITGTKQGPSKSIEAGLTFRYVKGGFAEANYQDYVEDLIKWVV